MQAIVKQEKSLSTLEPGRSVFVAANAGSGKTSLLTERVLALLLSGVRPGKILCLTFTNGAAAEMKTRISKALGAWVMMEEAALRTELEKLVPHVTGDMLALARSLFAQVLDAQVGLRLQTIHGFCQSLLARFPLEAGVGTHLSVIDDTTQNALLKEARMQLFARAQTAGGEEKKLLYDLVQRLGEHNLKELLDEMVKQKKKLVRFIEAQNGLPFAIRHLYRALGVAEHASFETLKQDHLKCDAPHMGRLEKIVEILMAGGKTDIKTASALRQWIGGTHDEQAALAYADYLLVDGRARDRRSFFGKKSLPPEEELLLLAEQDHMAQFFAAYSALRDAAFTESLLSIGVRLVEIYDDLKNLHGYMDFDDQILAATRLLSQSRMSQWVMFKLDGGIDHVLVDEAQDTSPEQWEIVRALTDEFFSGKGREGKERSLFVVGDEKQSIFRFQGADPAGLATNRAYFLSRLGDAAMPSENVALIHSWRSAPEILTLVDKVFEGPARAGLTADGDAIQHQPKRDSAKGYVELWPVTQRDEVRDWGADAVLAHQLADAIGDYVKRGLRPGDIMVLVRRRKRFVHQLARALKRRNIPVAGVDRMNLLENIAVRDLLAFAQVLLFPEDELTLAALLKSPLFNVDEEALFELCHGREGSLWQRLAEEESAAYALLSEFRAKVDYVSPFELFAELLDARGYRRAITGRMGGEYDEVLDIFLEQALEYEQGATPSMQGFLAWIFGSESEIKRDMEHAGGLVRIMTVHGAKGMQARLVIVADTTGLPTQKERMQWHGGAPLAATSSDSAGMAFKTAKEQEKALAQEEYRRLLYVALTRPEDMLIVCGAAYRSKTMVQEGSWYDLVAGAFAEIGTRQADGRITLGAPHIAAAAAVQNQDARAFPMLGVAPPEQDPPRPLAPSQIVAAEPAAPSPVAGAHIQKGVAIHRMLQYLPAISQDKREAVALSLAASAAPMLAAAEHAQLVSQVLAILDAPEYAPLFGEGSLPEVPISGMVGWRGRKVRVLGQVDRLYVTPGEVCIIDFKSGMRPPEAGKLPAAYLHQMALYAAVLKEIYPGRAVRAGLLWTAVPRLDWIAPQLLDEVPASAYI